ncbi:MAG: alpha/beta fold hydrolase [Balneolia bacterium]|nr:alpha/beta fold hydrolase [Balneolia bacterium]
MQSTNDYNPPLFLRNAHIQTIWPSLFRRVDQPAFERVRILTPDDDFLDIDRYGNTGKRAVIISHGLEGNSSRAYVLGMTRAFLSASYDVFAWNFRGCSGEMNLKPRFYHSGDTGDLETVAKYAINEGYSDITLIGFSMGGNMSLKYAGEQGDALPDEIRRICCFSVPCDLTSSALKLATAGGGIYMKRFMRMLKAKIRQKAAIMPDAITLEGLDNMTTFEEFDNAYTAPLHGFKDAYDYWDRASCKHVLTEIRRPALLVNALNDPFLTEACYPYEAASVNPYFRLETPEHGGHSGFPLFNGNGLYWHEIRAVRFAETQPG